MNNLELLQKNRKQIAKNNDIRWKLREDNNFLKATSQSIQTETIKELLDKFLDKMSEEGWAYDSYIRGSYSDEFTMFVSRRGNWLGSGISDKHRSAQINFLEALRHLNTVFIFELQEKDEEELLKLCFKWNIKNLEEAERLIK